MLHLEALANEYHNDTVRRAEQRRRIEEVLNHTPAPAGSKRRSRKLGRLLVVSGLKWVGWAGK